MTSRRHITAIAALTAVAALALPAAALAGKPSISPVDTVAIEVSKGTPPPTTSPSSPTSPSTGSGTSSDPVSAPSKAQDSPTVATYSGDTTPVPPPCDEVPSKDASAPSKLPVPSTCTTPTTPTEPTTVSTVTEPTTPVSGGGVVEEIETPEPLDVVSGSGAEPVEEAPVAGGGGPELPFTGLPLWYAIYGGAALLLLGVGMWIRARRAHL